MKKKYIFHLLQIAQFAKLNKLYKVNIFINLLVDIVVKIVNTLF